MARRRMIDPNFWDSEDVSRLSMFARLMFIGMVSNADDSGRGRANTNYLKSVIFPYDDIRVAEVDKALSEISHNTSVVVYEVARSKYYAFTNWERWQKVDHPTQSVIPPPPDKAPESASEAAEEAAYEAGETDGKKSFPNDSRTIRETLANDSPLIESNLIESNLIESKGRARFKKPTLEEVKAYCDERKNAVDPESFLDHYESNGWMVGKNKMKDWKAAVRQWEKRSDDFKNRKARSPTRSQQLGNKKAYEHHEYTDDDLKKRKQAAMHDMERIAAEI
jgi:hypothetical protein